MAHPFLLVPLCLYLATASRHIGLPDSAVIVDAMQGPVLSSNACNHNLNNLFGFVFNRLLPMGNIAWKSSLVSVLYGTAAVNLFYMLVIGLGASRAIAALCAAVYMVSHSMWWHSTTVESYGLSAVFLNTSLLLVVRDGKARQGGRESLRTMATLWLLAGLSLFNHLQNGVLSLACATTFLFRARGGRTPWPRSNVS